MDLKRYPLIPVHNMFLINIVFFSLLVTINTVKTDDELLAVSLLYRHGDRPPLEFYPNDPYQDQSFWPVPFGELTNVGKLQHYELGKWLRNRYDGFLSPIYNKSEIYIRSSDNNRCVMSAEANLAGLYPPQGKDIWNDDLLWQPIPVHTVPEKEDDVAEVQSSCQKYYQIKAAAEQLPYFSKINDENKDLYQYVTEQSGMNVSEIVRASDLFDILHIETINNMTLPNWTLEAYPKLEKLNDIVPELLTYTSQLARLFTGRFYDNVLSQFSLFGGIKYFSSDGRNEKFRVFSAHDDQVFSLLNALKVKNLKSVPYAATVIIELRKSEEKKLYVQVLYKTKETVADIVQIDGCDTKCELDQFLNIIKAIALTKGEFERECS